MIGREDMTGVEKMGCPILSTLVDSKLFDVEPAALKGDPDFKKSATTFLRVSPYHGHFFRNRIWRRTAVRHG